MPLLSLLLFTGATANSSPPELLHPSRTDDPSPDDPEENIKKFKAIAKTLPVPFVLYADFEAFLVPAEENKDSASNTRV